MEKEENGSFIGDVLFLCFSIAFGGFVTMKLWNGIITPTFSLMTLTFWQATGLDCFVSYLVPSRLIKDNGYTKTEIKVATTTLTLVYWGLGSIIMRFI